MGEEEREELWSWIEDRFAEHIGEVSDLEAAGRSGDQFVLGNGLARLRRMLELNLDHLRARRMDIR